MRFGIISTTTICHQRMPGLYLIKRIFVVLIRRFRRTSKIPETQTKQPYEISLEKREFDLIESVL